MEIITSNKNNRIRNLQRLNKDASYRKDKGVFIVEGIRMVKEVPADRLQALYISEQMYDRWKTELAAIGLKDDDERLCLLKDYIFETVSQTKSPQGVLAVVEKMDYGPNLLAENEKAPLYLIVESIQDPGNLGTIFRTAEAAGVHTLIIGGASCDCYNPKVVRATMGAIFRLPFFYTDNLERIMHTLKEQGVTIYGAHLMGGNLYDADFTGPTAFLVGNEGNGLSEAVSHAADRLLRIPMKGKTESLNAAVSSAILSYEALRQRERHK